ncbi:hypothetical protein [Actinoallomurus iriomotensis]|nr:hypothetical protein [Actinoallomurus iriomotensis]
MIIEWNTAMPGDPDRLLFDEDFVKNAAFTEPSARERGKRPGWRKRRRLARAERRRRRAMTRQRRGSRLKTTGTVLAVLVALAAVGALGWKVRGGRGLSPETTPVRRGAVPTLRAADPFEGSPAAAYADGAAGITPPAATATGGLSARDVEAAYARTRKRLVAAGLDRPTLLGGSPDAFARAVGPDERSYFVTNLNNPDLGKRTRSWVVTFAPNTAALSGPVIKVHGTMSAHPSAVNHLRGAGVRFDYLFVYPIERPGSPATLERLVVRLSGEVLFYPSGGTLHSHTSRWELFSDPARCDVRDGFIHPAYHDSAPERSPGTGPAHDPYDQSQAMPDDEKCLRSSGT